MKNLFAGVLRMQCVLLLISFFGLETAKTLAAAPGTVVAWGDNSQGQVVQGIRCYGDDSV